MNAQVIPFNFENTNDIRVIIKDDDPWFCAADVCRVLNLLNGKDVVRKQMDKDGVDQIYLIDKLGRKQINNIISEPNLYRLIFRSDKPVAKKFQKWVFDDVLPTIRKTGRYETPKPSPGLLPYQQRAVQKRVSWLVKNQVGTTYTGIYGQIKDKFHVGSYKDVTQVQFPMLCKFLNMPVPEAIEHDQPDLIGVGWSQHEKIAYLSDVAKQLCLVEDAVFMTYSDVKRIYERAEKAEKMLKAAIDANNETLVLCEKYPDLLNGRPIGSKAH